MHLISPQNGATRHTNPAIEKQTYLSGIIQ